MVRYHPRLARPNDQHYTPENNPVKSSITERKTSRNARRLRFDQHQPYRIPKFFSNVKEKIMRLANPVKRFERKTDWQSGLLWTEYPNNGFIDKRIKYSLECLIYQFSNKVKEKTKK